MDGETAGGDETGEVEELVEVTLGREWHHHHGHVYCNRFSFCFALSHGVEKEACTLEAMGNISHVAVVGASLSLSLSVSPCVDEHVSIYIYKRREKLVRLDRGAYDLWLPKTLHDTKNVAPPVCGRRPDEGHVSLSNN